MKKFTIALISALVALASCDTGLLVQTPGQPPQIVGVEVNDALINNLYVLVGGTGALGLTQDWNDDDTTPAQFKMQIVNGQGSLKFATPATLNLGQSFKFRLPGNWAGQVGLENPGSGDTANFDFNALKAGFTGKTYKIVITVTSVGGDSGIKQFAKAELVEVASADDVRAPNPVTGAIASGPAPTYVKIGSVAITNGAATQTYFLTGSDLLKHDKTDYLTGLTRFASSAKDGPGKDFALTTAADGTVTKTFSVKKDSYAAGTLTPTEVTINTPYLAKPGAVLRIDLPFKDADGNVLATGVPLTISTALVDQLDRALVFRETPNRVYNLTYNVGTGAWTINAALATTGFTITGLHFGLDTMPAGVTFASTTGTSGNAARVRMNLTVNNFYGTQVLGIKSSRPLFADATTNTDTGDWNSTLSRGATVDGTKSWSAWFVPAAPADDWGWGEIPTAGAFVIGAQNGSGGLDALIRGSENENFALSADAGDTVTITIDADLP